MRWEQIQNMFMKATKSQEAAQTKFKEFLSSPKNLLW